MPIPFKFKLALLPFALGFFTYIYVQDAKDKVRRWCKPWKIDCCPHL